MRRRDKFERPMYNHVNKPLMIQELEADAKKFAEMAGQQSSERLKKQYEVLSANYLERAQELKRLR